MTTLRRMTAFAVVMGGIAACSPSSNTVAPGGGALVSSALAQEHGIGRYVMRDGNVDVMGVDGVQLAVLHVSAPSSASRLVRIDYPLGRYAENEVTRPLVDGTFHAPVTRDRDGAIQADPALAPFFAAHQLVFDVLPSDASPAALGPDAIASCGDIPWVSGCSLRSCSTTQDYWDGGLHITQVLGIAGCAPASNCGFNCYGEDEVSKHRTCNDPGSCSNQANGWTGNCLKYYCNAFQSFCCEGTCSGSPCP